MVFNLFLCHSPIMNQIKLEYLSLASFFRVVSLPIKIRDYPNGFLALPTNFTKIEKR
jgi:rhodanese-related sulfurtransferase